MSDLEQFLQGAQRVPGTAGGGFTGEFYDPNHPPGQFLFRKPGATPDQTENLSSVDERRYYNRYRVDQVPARTAKRTVRAHMGDDVVEDPPGSGQCRKVRKFEVKEYERKFYLVTQYYEDWLVRLDLKRYYDFVTGPSVSAADSAQSAAGIVTVPTVVEALRDPASHPRHWWSVRKVRELRHGGPIAQRSAGTARKLGAGTFRRVTQALPGYARGASAASGGSGAAAATGLRGAARVGGKALGLVGFAWTVFDLTTNAYLATGLAPDVEQRTEGGGFWHNVKELTPGPGQWQGDKDDDKGFWGPEELVRSSIEHERGELVPCRTRKIGLKLSILISIGLLLGLLLGLATGRVTSGDDDSDESVGTPTTAAPAPGPDEEVGAAPAVPAVPSTPAQVCMGVVHTPVPSGSQAGEGLSHLELTLPPGGEATSYRVTLPDGSLVEGELAASDTNRTAFVPIFEFGDYRLTLGSGRGAQELALTVGSEESSNCTTG